QPTTDRKRRRRKAVHRTAPAQDRGEVGPLMTHGGLCPIQRSRRDLYQFAIMLKASGRSPSLRASAIVVRSRTCLADSATLAKTRLISQFFSVWQSAQGR